MKLFYRHFGNGWPMIIIHGLYGSSDNWLSIAKILEKHFSIYLVDLRNHGNSPHSDEHSYEAMANDLNDFIDTLGLKMPIIVGHSMGGKVAMNYGLLFPSKVERMIVVDISPLANNIQHKKHLVNHQNIISALRNLPVEQLETRKDAEIFLQDRIPSDRERNFLLKNLTRAGHKFRWKLNLNVLARNMGEIMGGFPLNDPKYLNQQQFPILFIKGNNSDYIEPVDVEAIEAFYPKAKIIKIENAGHWVHAEQPEKLLEAIQNFCTNESDFV